MESDFYQQQWTREATVWPMARQATPMKKVRDRYSDISSGPQNEALGRLAKRLLSLDS